MATNYKNIVITPNIGSSTDDPKIQFSGGNTSVNTDITLKVYPNSNGSLSFEGSAGQLFSITNDLSNSLFAISDVSGIPSVEVFANSLISLAPFGGNVVIGNSAELIISSGAGLYANGALGSAGEVLHSNGSSVYWATDANYARLDASGTFASRMTATASQSTSLLSATSSLGGVELQSANSTSAAFMCFHRPGVYASYFGIDTDNNFAVGGWSAGAALGLMKVGSFGVGTAASGTAGEIRATNNITAYYSDKRLKTNIKKIEFALEKVNKISGVTFISNDEAAKYGYTDTKTQVGVIAQEIEDVLPEVVVPAPFDIGKNEDGTEYSLSGQNYKTVQYEKLVPLLIEAIKEVSSKVETLEKQIKELQKK